MTQGLNRQRVIRVQYVHCDCGERKIVRTGDRWSMNAAGQRQFKKHSTMVAEVVGFSRDGRCIHVRFDGYNDKHVMAFSFFHQGTFRHEQWEKEERSS